MHLRLLGGACVFLILLGLLLGGCAPSADRTGASAQESALTPAGLKTVTLRVEGMT